MTDTTIADAIHLSRRLGRLLHGLPPDVQGATLADLLASWLAGHVVLGDPAATDRMREMLLMQHNDTVRKLIPFNAPVSPGQDTDEK